MPVVHQGSTYVGNSTSTAHQIWSGGKSGKFGFGIGPHIYISDGLFYRHDSAYLWTWSGFELDGTPNSVKFTPDPVNGGLQGDFSYGTGSPNSAYPQAVSTYNQTHKVMEVDPAGGILEFSMVARELSYWHKIGPLLRVSNTSQLGNQININEFRTYFFDNKSQYTVIDLPYSIAEHPEKSLYYVKSTNTYSCEYEFTVHKSDTSISYQPSKTNKNDLTFTCYIGPNNTPYSAYTYIDVVGFLNELGWIEYNNPQSVNPYFKGELYEPDVSYSIINAPIGRPIPVDKLLTGSTDYESYYGDWRTGNINSIPNQRLICLWQKPNVLYYVHMLWVNPLHTDYDTAPSEDELLTRWTTNWSLTDYDLLLYVEFGISPNGGHDIFWNNATTSGTLGDAVQKIYDRGMTATVPSDIHNYIHPNIESSSLNRQNASPYTVTSSKTETSNQPFKFVRINVHLSSKNDEHNNLSANRYQRYSILNYKQLDGNVQTTPAFDPSNNGFHYAKHDSSGTTCFQYQIGRKYKTANWTAFISASLYYENNGMRYEGETTIH